MEGLQYPSKKGEVHAIMIGFSGPARCRKLQYCRGVTLDVRPPPIQVICPTWAEDIDCFGKHEGMQKEQQQRMQEEYNQVQIYLNNRRHSHDASKSTHAKNKIRSSWNLTVCWKMTIVCSGV